MKKYNCIKKFGNTKIGTVFIESGKIHPKWNKKMYFKEGGGENDWVLENHVKEVEYFELIK